MSEKNSPHLNALKHLLDDAGKAQIFPCIQDLVSNGLVPFRFSDGETMPTRQDITQFLAAWLRHIGVSPDACSEWLIGYCVDILSPISSSSLSQIRHSTRSNIKYINRSEVAFDCGCEHNAFKAACSRSCPVYDEMEIRRNEPKKREIRQIPRPETLPKERAVVIPELPVKAVYGEQFEAGLKFIEESVRQGVALKKIVALLNDRGLKTRTGRQWTYPILTAEIHKNNLDALVKR